MALTHKRKLKNIIATTVAYTLSIILLEIIILSVFEIIGLVVTILECEEIGQTVLIIGIIFIVKMLKLEFRKG